MKGEKASCAYCGTEFIKKNSHAKYCQGNCAYQEQRRRTLERSINHYKIWERDQYKCFYCGRSAVEDKAVLEIDHVIPTALGGTNTTDNVVTVCRDCNCSKLAYLPDAETITWLLAEVARRNETQYKMRTSQRASQLGVPSNYLPPVLTLNTHS